MRFALFSRLWKRKRKKDNGAIRLTEDEKQALRGNSGGNNRRNRAIRRVRHIGKVTISVTSRKYKVLLLSNTIRTNNIHRQRRQ